MPIRMRWVPLSLLAVAGCTETTPASIPPVPPPAPGIALVSIEPTGRSIAVGESLQFQATTNVATITSWIWAVSSAEIASVDAAGLVRGLRAGTVYVRACGEQQPAVCGSATLTVH